VDRWTSYREIWFQKNSATIQDSERSKLAEMATYMNSSPSLQLGIDTSMDPRNRDLSNRRYNAIRDALVDAGMSSRMITNGAYGDETLRREGRVDVLIASVN
jgi:outer membrane protein OmpA-like peptidoglycan-associated protein